MTRQAIAQGAEFVLWPESSTPFIFEEDARRVEPDSHAGAAGAGADPRRQRSDRARPRRQLQVLQLGVSRARRRHDRRRRIARCTWCRSASTCRSSGCCSSPRRWSRRCPISPPGDDAVLLPVGGHLISTAICYEVVYPDLVRQFVAGGSELLTTITNDAWFGRDVGAVPAFRAGLDARDRGRALPGPRPPTPASAASSIRTAACSSGPTSSSRRCSSARRGSCGRRRSTRASATSSRTRRSS